MKRLLFAILAVCLVGTAQQTITINGMPPQNVVLPTPTSSALGGVKSVSQVTNQWVQYLDTTGTPQLAQPAFSNLNGSLACTQAPALTGDVTTTASSCATTVAKIGGNTVSLGGALTTGGAVTLTGAYGFTGTLTSTTAVTFPTSGTLATLGANTYTKTQLKAVNTVASGATPAFDLSLGNIQYVSALAINATASFTNLSAGGSYNFVICNNATGGYTWTWPASVHGGMTIGTTASKCSIQTLTSPDGSTLYATGLPLVNL